MADASEIRSFQGRFMIPLNPFWSTISYLFLLEKEEEYWLFNAIPIYQLDWYKIDRIDVGKFGGASLLMRRYNGSPIEALESVYPEYQWNGWMFNKVNEIQNKSPHLSTFLT